jgi:phosphoglycolate phosphatase-like HAD superfamily hydrolase
MTLVLFWDIDGTLLTTARAGIVAWERALEDVAGRAVDLAELETAGLTDVEIAARLLSAQGLDSSADGVGGLVAAYEAWLPRSLPLRAGRVLPGVLPILERLRGRADVVSLLLTGNTAAGARAKLRHYGLEAYFVGGAFADGLRDRAAVASRALAIARDALGREPDPASTYVIGDTPHDIVCARAIGARAVGVATGQFPVAELERHGAWWAVSELPDPEAFLERLRSGAR